MKSFNREDVLKVAYLYITQLYESKCICEKIKGVKF